MPLLTLFFTFSQNKGKLLFSLVLGLMVVVGVGVGGFCLGSMLGFFGLPPSFPFSFDASIL